MSQECGCRIILPMPETGRAYGMTTTDIETACEIVYCPLHQAAPELLEALHRAEPWLGRLIADGGHLKAVSPTAAEEALRMVSQAIATVEGH